MTFTTRPEIKGTFGVAASTHWIASAVGMNILEKGGTAFDAAAAMGFTLHIVEPHLNGPLGDMPALIWLAGEDSPHAVCGQGTAPAKATIAHYKSEGLDLIPGSGLLATVIPGAFDAWMLILRDHGRLPLRDILEPAIHYARNGHPMLPRVSDTIAGLADFFRDEWPTSHATWLPGGNVPQPDALFANPAIADTWERLLTEAESAGSKREVQIDAARNGFYKGFISEAIDKWMNEACVMDAAGERRKGILGADDMAGWQATYEKPLAVDYEGWTIWKCGIWSQGPVMLQTLRILEGCGIGNDDLNGEAFVHRVTEAMKLAFADREAYYGDPAHTDIPAETLLSRDYAGARRKLLEDTASTEQRPGRIEGFDAWCDAAINRARMDAPVTGIGAGEPTMAHLTEKRGDTVHIDVIDRWGNAFSGTPSGGWLQSSPVVPGLGMPLNSRAQMFWLDGNLPSSLMPGRRPRTTLSPSMAKAPDETCFAFGTPGGDQQDQWQTILFLRLVHAEGKINLQHCIDSPLFHTAHFQSSFYPRAANPGHLMLEPAFGKPVINALEKRGHRIEISEPWAVGRLTAASRSPDGMMKAAATPRLMQAYAIGR